MNRPARTLEDWDRHAILFWPDEMREQIASINNLSLLLDTQSQFIALLNLSDVEPDTWKVFLARCHHLTADMFLQHLMLVSNLGYASLSKLIPLSLFFPDATMCYLWRGKEYTYHFQKQWREEDLHSSTCGCNDALTSNTDMDPWIEDAIMLLLHGSTVTNAELPDFCKERCIIGRCMSMPYELQRRLRPVYMLSQE